MTTPSRHIPKALKELLINESGGKCANPGCSNVRSEIHHIEHWAVVKTHDAKHMIAVCPSCHDACHNGKLKITEEDLYIWKKIERSSTKGFGHIFVEPSAISRLLTGSISLSTDNNQKLIAFNLSKNDKLEFSIDDDFLKVSTQLSDPYGNIIIKVKDNNLTFNKDPDITFLQRQGRVQITVPMSKYYLPAHAIFQMRNIEPDFASDNRVIALDLQVVKPGTVRVKGFWNDDTNSIVITDDTLNFCSLGQQRPTTLRGEGEDTVLVVAGPVESSLFGF